MTKYIAHQYFNESRNRFFKWEPGDTMTKSEYTYHVEADTPEEAAEQAFMYFNRDNRPNGRTERSLSVGDLVVLVPTEEVHKAIILWCSNTLFKRLTQEEYEKHIATALIS
jgi:hypothetical protein